MIEQYTINTKLLDLKFPELQKLGADCIGDIDHVDLLINLRHMYLSVAMDFCVANRRANIIDENEFEVGVLYCEFAEKLQELIELGYS